MEAPFEIIERSGREGFGPSARALKQRRWLFLFFKFLAGACLGLALGWGGWVAAAVLLFAPGERFLTPLHRRRLILHEQALELQRGEFRRFVVFENLKHVQAWQDPGQRLIALHLHTADDSLLLRDLEGLGEVFVAISAAKPAGVMIEVEEQRVDWGEPLPWMVSIVAVAGIVIATALY